LLVYFALEKYFVSLEPFSVQSENYLDTIKAGFFQFPTNLGISGEVFTSGMPQIIHDTKSKEK